MSSALLCDQQHGGLRLQAPGTPSAILDRRSDAMAAVARIFAGQFELPRLPRGGASNGSEAGESTNSRSRLTTSRRSPWSSSNQRSTKASSDSVAPSSDRDVLSRDHRITATQSEQLAMEEQRRRRACRPPSSPAARQRTSLRRSDRALRLDARVGIRAKLRDELTATVVYLAARDRRHDPQRTERRRGGELLAHEKHRCLRRERQSAPSARDIAPAPPAGACGRR